MALKLELGKAYRTRGGERVVITSTISESEFPYGREGKWLTFRTNGTHCDDVGCTQDIIAEWIDEPEQEPQLPDVEWGGELQVRGYDDAKDSWSDVTIIWHDEELAIGWEAVSGPEFVAVWHYGDWQFRNKPPEPKRVKGWLKVWRHKNGMLGVAVFNRGTYQLSKQEIIDNHPQDIPLLAVIEIDAPEGHGLND